MKVFLNSNFEIENISNESGDPIVRGSDKFNKLHIFVPTNTVNSYNTISPLYSVKRADGRVLGNYATITTHDNTEAFNGYYGWKGDFNPRDIAVAGALELTISFKMKKTAASVEMTKAVAKITLEVKEAVVVLDDVLVLGDGDAWISLSESITALTSNLSGKADKTNTQQEITAAKFTANSFKKGDAELATEAQVSEEATARQNADDALQTDINTRVKIADIINALNDTSTNKPLSAYQGKLLKDAIDGINALLQSNDTDLDELQEIVTYIKNNKSLIDGITSSKISFSDIVDNLTSELANKPLSAKQGYILKGLIDALQTAVDNRYTKSETNNLLDGKADKSTTYTKTQVNNLLDNKQNITIPAITIAGIEYTNLEAAINAINDYAETIEQVIGSISGSDTTIATRLTQLESSVSSLNSAWTTFTTGTSADNIINTLVEIQQELAKFNIIDVNSSVVTQEQYDSINEYTLAVKNNIYYNYLKTGTSGSANGYHYFFAFDGTKFSTVVIKPNLQVSVGSTTFENQGSKVSAWSSTPNDFHYPSEKLVKDSLDSETSRATTQENKSLYHLGAFDSADGKTRQTGVVDLSKLSWQYQSAVGCWYAENVIPNATECVASNYTCYNNKMYSALVDGELTTNNSAWGAIDTIIIKDSQSNYPKGILQYKLATPYPDTPIEGESILPLDSNMANKLRQAVVETLNLWKYGNYNVSLPQNTAGDFSIKLYSSSTLVSTLVYTATIGHYEGTFTKTDNTNILQFYISGSNRDNYNNYDISDLPNGTYTISIDITGNTYSNVNITNIMLNSGSHSYPPSDYHASKHITDEEATNLHNAEGVLLWENPSPESAFSNQTITTKDMSKYKYIVFEYLISHTAGDGYAHTFQKFKRSSTVGEKYVLSIASYGQGVAVCYREIENYSSNANQLKIMAGKYVDNSTNETNNDVCVPIAVYGTNIL